MKRHLTNIAFMATALAVALGSYLVSARVAAERAAVDGLKGAIQADMEDIQGLEAELRIRARLPQLERWNSEVLALQAPQAGQFARDALHLAAVAQPLLPAAPPAAGVTLAGPADGAAGPAAPGATPTQLASTADAAVAPAARAAAAMPAALPARAPAPLAPARASAPLAPTLVAVALVPGGPAADVPAALASVRPAGAAAPSVAASGDIGLAIAAELARLPAPTQLAGQ